MSYRKLKDGSEYKIGKRFVHIRNKDTKYKKVVEKSEIGFGFNLNDDNRNRAYYMITPGMIRDFIADGKIGPPERYFPHCDHSNVKRTLCAAPFDAEIHEKIRYCVLCDDCYKENAWQI